MAYGARDHSRTPRNSAGGIDEIVQLVVQREQARLSKDWASADSYRDRLQSMGVTLFDKTNQWKASDGRSGRIPTFTEIEAGTATSNIMEPAAPVYNTDTEDGQIKNLVQQREQARAAKDFDQSDRLREELKSLGVELYDKDKMWKSSTGLSGVIIGYRGTGGPTDIEITTLVTQREKARQNNDYSTADMIREELKERGVNIFDKDKVWKASDGRSGMVPTWGTGSGVMTMALATQPQVMPQPAMPNIQALMNAVHMNLANPATAPRTMELLRQAAAPMPPQPTGGGYQTAGMGSVGVAGKSKEMQDATRLIESCQWRTISDSEIAWLIEVREKARKSKDFGTSDQLRNIMRDKLGLELLEREKRWTMSDGRQGAIPTWSSLG